MLWGRLGYDRGLDRNFFIKHMEKRYGLDDAGWLYDVWQSASGIIPMVNRFHWRDWDTHWAVEGCMARPRLGGFRDVFDFMNNPTLEGSGILTPMEFAVNTLAGEAQEEGISPLEIADSLELLAEHALLSIKSIEPGFNQAEYRTLLQDISSQALLGKYYSSKIRAAVHLSLFKLEGISQEKAQALNELDKSLSYWNEYSNISGSNYKPQMLARTNLLDLAVLSDSIVKEIELVKAYEPWQ